MTCSLHLSPHHKYHPALVLARRPNHTYHLALVLARRRRELVELPVGVVDGADGVGHAVLLHHLAPLLADRALLGHLAGLEGRPVRPVLDSCRAAAPIAMARANGVP